jgi:cytochrome c peroxidase
VFNGAGQCATCHAGPTFTDANTRLHPPAEVPTDPVHAERSATGMYRTTPLRALWAHAPYFHDGSAATLEDVVNLYDSAKNLQLTAEQKADLVEYLKSL